MSRQDPHAALVALFAVTIISLPVELAVSAKFGEPYPGIFQPGFGGVPEEDGAIFYERPEVAIVDSSGSKSITDFKSLAPDVGSESQVVLARAIGETDSRRSPETVDFLRKAAQGAVGGTPTQLAISWVSYKYDLETRQSTRLSNVRTIIIPLS